MPSSYTQNIPFVMAALERMCPGERHRFLDVGTGYGKYAFLIRERLDDFRWQHTIDGVEIFEDYLLRSRAGFLYDGFYIGNFLDFEPPGSLYDVTLLIDVLEHFEAGDAALVLSKALRMSKHVLVVTPVGYEQGARDGNEHEAHLSEWDYNVMFAFAENYSMGVNLEILPAGTQDTRFYHLILSERATQEAA